MMKGDVAPQESYIHSLDLLRGFAALSVCLYHTGFLLMPGYHILPGGYLCVDLFFLLSGFVIARTYDRRIASGMVLGAFAIQRLARLYPLFLVTTLVGFFATNAHLYEELHTFGGAKAFLTLIGNLLLIPNLLKPYHMQSLFPFNGATWSIFFEFYVNILFFLCWRFITMRRLMAAIALCAVMLVVTAAQAHSLDIGSNSADLARAVPRVLFSFFVGVLVSRAALSHPRRYGVWGSLCGLAIVLCALSLRGLLPTSLVWISDVTVVMLVFPAILVAFTHMRFPDYHARASAFLGNISYSVYLLQTPLMVMYAGLPRLFLHEQIASFAPWAGLVFLPAIMTLAFLVWKYFEVPAKRAVRRWHASLSETLGAA